MAISQKLLNRSQSNFEHLLSRYSRCHIVNFIEIIQGWGFVLCLRARRLYSAKYGNSHSVFESLYRYIRRHRKCCHYECAGPTMGWHHRTTATRPLYSDSGVADDNRHRGQRSCISGLVYTDILPDKKVTIYHKLVQNWFHSVWIPWNKIEIYFLIEWSAGTLYSNQAYRKLHQISLPILVWFSQKLAYLLISS